VPRIERSARITWEGNAARGTGTITADTGAFSGLGFSLPARVGAPEGKTSPEELLAAAHGGCITMSLSGELSRDGTPPGRLDVSCRIVMDEVDGQGHQIVASHVEMVAAVAGLDNDALRAAVARADEGCPFSALLRRAGAEVHVVARLAPCPSASSQPHDARTRLSVPSPYPPSSCSSCSRSRDSHRTTI
jgi:osmotically inducible protein OsmC